VRKKALSIRKKHVHRTVQPKNSEAFEQVADPYKKAIEQVIL
jgi:hypothetical protein